MNSKFNVISVVGLGYIGLPTAAVIASKGYNVIGVDINEATVNIINQGGVHIVEPGLEDSVQIAVRNGCLRAVSIPEYADAFLIAVPTPFKNSSDGAHSPNLDYIESAAKSIAPVLKSGNIVVLESTSPVGTTEKMAEWLAEYRPDLTFPQTHGDNSDIRIAYCPERVLPGRVLDEIVNNDRIIGGLTQKCSDVAALLYKIFVNGDCVVTDARTAEMCKLTENSFRDVNIAFANELSMICDDLNIDVWRLITLANRHPRVNILQPGPGVGGHCIAVDPWFIVSATPDKAKIIALARNVNDSKAKWVIEKVKSSIQTIMHKKRLSESEVTLACMGLAFKSNIDDLRESPSLQITRELSKLHSGKVLAVEPHINTLPEVENFFLVNLEEAIREADIIVMLVDHNEFDRLNAIDLTDKVIIDTRGVIGKN
jgi:UDP-N-acetyl-D-mannosaminuronic acid dehydrogenase